MHSALGGYGEAAGGVKLRIGYQHHFKRIGVFSPEVHGFIKALDKEGGAQSVSLGAVLGDNGDALKIGVCRGPRFPGLKCDDSVRRFPQNTADRRPEVMA